MSENKKKCEICGDKYFIYITYFNCYMCGVDCDLYFCEDCYLLIPNNCIGCRRDIEINKILN